MEANEKLQAWDNDKYKYVRERARWNNDPPERGLLLTQAEFRKVIKVLGQNCFIGNDFVLKNNDSEIDSVSVAFGRSTLIDFLPGAEVRTEENGHSTEKEKNQSGIKLLSKKPFQ